MTALADGYFELPAPFLMKDDHALPDGPEPLRLDINAFLVTTADRTILIDTGCGALLGPTVNRLAEQLALAGRSLFEVDTVLCTHIHPDHTNGLVDASGMARFPNAQIHVHRNEFDFWLSDERMAQAPEELRIQFLWARQAFAPYLDRVLPFERGQVLNGVEAVPLFGHTPGHSGFLFDGGGSRQLIVWGDVVHAIDVQVRDPEVTVVADLDPRAASETRRRIFDRVASDDVMFAGMHVGFPSFSRLDQDGGVFRYRGVE
ncbi:MBL fold metallo-hydrolase [Sphingomonas sp. R86520]|uniref:MBL fold metallo-hydrolase n=1 Tax=Sphingomonas sp. R86520 TaxID=3093859 RepID=UPI0036D27560